MRRIVTAAGKTRDAAQIAQYNYRFHTLIHQAADNQYLLKTLDSVRETLVLVGRSTMVLAEGEYTAIARNKDKVYQRNFKVTAGRDSDVEVLMKDQAPEEMSGDFE